MYHVLPAGFKQHSGINDTDRLSCGEALVITSSSLTHATGQHTPNAVLHSERSDWGQGRSHRGLLLNSPSLAVPIVPPTHLPLDIATSISSRASFSMIGHTMSVRIFSSFWGGVRREWAEVSFPEKYSQPEGRDWLLVPDQGVHWILPTDLVIAAEELLKSCVLTLFPNTRLPRIFLLMVLSLWRISGWRRMKAKQRDQATLSPRATFTHLQLEPGPKASTTGW